MTGRHDRIRQHGGWLPALAGLLLAMLLAAPAIATADQSAGAEASRASVAAERCKDKKRSCGNARKRGPKAKQDKAKTSEESAVKIDVLANDRRRRSLKIVAVKDRNATGSVSIVGRRSRIKYDPDGRFEALAAGEKASDSFTYKVKNKRGRRDSATVKVKVRGLDDPSTVTATPALYPEYSPEVTDYVTRCNGDPVQIDADAGPGNSIDVDGQGARKGEFTTGVPLQAGQRFSFVRATGAGQATHDVRCLPAGFPEWTYEKFAPAQQQWYIVVLGQYVIVIDGNGVPVWWFDDPGSPSDAKFLENGTFAWVTDRGTPMARYEMRIPNGSLVREMKTVGTMTDGHDLQLLANGNYLLMSYKQRATTVDLTPYGGPNSANVLDAEVQEVTPGGAEVWSWNSAGYVGLEETGHWFDDFVLANPTQFGPGYDIVHINSAEVTSDNSLLISMRHTDGVFSIDRTTKEINWKLGGTPTPESLTVIGDPFGANPFGGQHDARMNPDGTLTVFDNGETRNRPPRAVRYEIDESAGTATYMESVNESAAPGAFCCGSARRSDAGSWVVSWGGGATGGHPVSEFAADGTRTFRITFEIGFTYRAHPVPFGELGAATLRNGMDAQHPR